MDSTDGQLIPVTAKEKMEKKVNPVQYYVKVSFMITYTLLLTTGIITFVEAMRAKVDTVRHVMNLETCISLVAAYFYSIFIAKIGEFEKQAIPIEWPEITKTRYVDWSITTPMMLLALTIVLGYNVGKKVELGNLLTILALNYAMLYIGYLGEVNYLSKWVAMLGGFVPFVAMFSLIYYKYVQPKYRSDNYILYIMYLIVWGMYGIVYMLSEEYKNIWMNVLDCIAKCFSGLGLWIYYIRVIRV